MREIPVCTSKTAGGKTMGAKYIGPKRSPLDSIRAHCLWCCGGSPKEVNVCTGEGFCSLWPYRHGSMPDGESRRLLKVIREYCLHCVGDAPEVKGCVANEPCAQRKHGCTLWPYRLGRSPNVSAETRKKRSVKAKKQLRKSAPQTSFRPQSLFDL
jgi:hypothetical protein